MKIKKKKDIDTFDKRELELIRRSLISKESEEMSLMHSYKGTNDYPIHYENVVNVQELRRKVERMMQSNDIWKIIKSDREK